MAKNLFSEMHDKRLSGEQKESEKTSAMRAEIDNCMQNKNYSKVKHKLKEYHDLMLLFESYRKYPQYLSDIWLTQQWDIYHEFLDKYVKEYPDLDLVPMQLYFRYKTENPYRIQI